MAINLPSQNRRRGVTVVQVMVAMPLLVGGVAIAIDVGMMYNARTELHRAADAAALSAISVLAYAADADAALPEATDVAVTTVEINPVLGRKVTVAADTDVVFGRAYYDEFANKYNFVGGDVPTNAVAVSIHQSENSVNGALPLHFAGVFGKAATDVSARSVAIFVERRFEEGDCADVLPASRAFMCHYGDSDDSDDSQGEFGPADSDDSDDSDSGDSDGADTGDSDDSDDSEAGDSDDSDDSADSDSGDSDSGDSESGLGGGDSDGPRTIHIDAAAMPFFLERGDTSGPCMCIEGDSDDSDDSQGEFGPPDSDDSDDSDSGDSDGSTDGDSDDSDDSQGEFGLPDSDDSDDSDSGDSDGDSGGDSDDSDDSQGEFGLADSDDSDDSDAGPGGGPGGGNPGVGAGVQQVTICHIPPGNPDNPQTITIGAPAVNPHLNHGDTFGVCFEDRNVEIFLIE